MTVETVIGFAQLGALIEIARRLGSLGTEVDNMKRRVKRLEGKVRNHV